MISSDLAVLHFGVASVCLGIILTLSYSCYGNPSLQIYIFVVFILFMTEHSFLELSKVYIH